jgi:hydrogenase expression/formation protein HypC
VLRRREQRERHDMAIAAGKRVSRSGPCLSGTLIALGRTMCLAIPGEVVSTYDREDVRYASVRFGGITREVCLHAFPDTAIGEFVLVHVGFAIAKIDRVEAARAWEALVQLGELDLGEAPVEEAPVTRPMGTGDEVP